MIQEMYPQFTTLINPAATQAEQVRDYLTQKQELDEGGRRKLPDLHHQRLPGLSEHGPHRGTEGAGKH